MSLTEPEWRFIDYVSRRFIEKELSKPRKTTWPPMPTLLTCPADLLPAYLNGLGNRDKWTLTDWQAYDEYLQASGQTLTARLDNSENQLQRALHKLSRKPKDNPDSSRGNIKQTLLTGLYSPTPPSDQPEKPKRGRPAKDWSETDQLIDEAHTIQAKATYPIGNEQALRLAAKHLKLSQHAINRLITPSTLKRFSARYPKH